MTLSKKTFSSVRWLFVAGVVMASSLGGAATAANTPADASAAVSKAKKQSVSRVKFDAGSGETRAQRIARLKRECKGLPNAGACLGYAS